MTTTPELKLDHVSLMVTDAPRALAFYRDVLGLMQLERPAFASVGVWLTTGNGLQVHLVQYKPEAPRPPRRPAASDDAHFALRTADFEAFVQHIAALGYNEDVALDDPRRIRLRLEGPAGFPQVYLLDPDCNIIEVNAAAVSSKRESVQE